MPNKSDCREMATQRSNARAERRKLLLEDRKSLPVYACRERLLEAIREHQMLVIVGATGSGKTTQIPQYLHEAGYSRKGKIGCIQPHKAAALTVSAQVAKEMDIKLGNEVGYSILFEDCLSNTTVLKFMTAKIFLREISVEMNLASYSVVIIDGALQRKLSTDILFGLLKCMMVYQPNLKLLISSATIDAQKFSDFFGGAPTFDIPGRQFSLAVSNTTQKPYSGNSVLLMKSLHELFDFKFMDPPHPKMLSRALSQLYALGAVNVQDEITSTGKRMAVFPIDPMLAKVLVASDEYKCSVEIITICAMLFVGNSIFYSPHAWMKFHGIVGDHISLLKVYDDWKKAHYSTRWCSINYIQVRSLWRAREIRDQLGSLLRRAGIVPTSSPNELDIQKAITSGFFPHIAKLQKNGSYRTVKSQQIVSIHPSSVLFQVATPPRVILYHELVGTTKKYMRQVIEIKPDWLLEIAPPHYYKMKDIEDCLGYKMPKGPGILPLSCRQSPQNA